MDMKISNLVPYLISDIIGCIFAVSFCMDTGKPLKLVLGILYLVTVVVKWFTWWLLQ